MDASEENEWRQRPLRVSVKEQEITREELTATVLQKYLQNNHPEFEQLEIRHSEEGEPVSYTHLRPKHRTVIGSR